MTLKDELLEQVRTAPQFDMSTWIVDECADHVPTCDTAGCMAGFLAALRPERAVALGWGDGSLPDEVATKIWEEEMGKCYLDFMGADHPALELGGITREDVIAHIEAGDGSWPGVEAAS